MPDTFTASFQNDQGTKMFSVIYLELLPRYGATTLFCIILSSLVVGCSEDNPPV